ncbi:MAG: glycosyltransferase, partial [Comamonadaceae bacterium]|nr:glycosyltransferase [Comamonadaceae bacterium]
MSLANAHALDDVTIVIVTYNSAHCLPRQGELLRACPHVIVVDNGSRDGSPEAARRHLPQARVLALSHNLGFGAANNRGLAQVRTPLALLLNPDCEMSAEAVCALVEAARRWPEAAIVAPQLVEAHGAPEVNYRFALTDWPARGPGAEGECCVGFICGAAMLWRMERFKGVGGFDERFFLYYEDDDLCLRLRQAGRPMLIAPQVRARHRSRGSVRGRQPWRAEYLRGYHHAQSKLIFASIHQDQAHACRLRRALLLGTTATLPLRLLLPKPGLVARMWGRWRGAWAWHGLPARPAAASRPPVGELSSVTTMPFSAALKDMPAAPAAATPAPAGATPEESATFVRWAEPPLGRGSLCIAVLTLNEARRIENCLRSAAFADQVVVVDSGSSDETCAMAERLGAQVVHQPDWRGFGPQRNHQLAACQAEYIFFLDADEEIGPDLRAELQAIVASGEDAVWEVQWAQVAYGRALTLMKSTGGVVRLFKTASLLRYEGAVHEHAVTRPGLPQRRLRAKLLHHSRETVRGSLEKLTQYAMLGAAKRAQQGKQGGVLRGMGSALAVFLRLYVLRRGFLCGGEGF